MGACAVDGVDRRLVLCVTIATVCAIASAAQHNTVNTNDVRDREGLDTPLATGDVLTILPAVSGG